MKKLAFYLLFVALAHCLFFVQAHPRSKRLAYAADVEKAIPFFVRLSNITRVGKGGSASTICGGAIISREWVITAAHCLFLPKTSPCTFFVPDDLYVGTQSRDVPSSKFYEVDEVILHNDYKIKECKKPQENDLALIRLKVLLPRGLAVKLRVKPVIISEIMTLYGQGHTELSNNTSQYTKQVTLPVVSVEKCQNLINAANLTDKTICGFDEPDMKKGACVSDSGSPVVIDDELVGLISVGAYHCSHAVDITNVIKYKDWIEQNTGGKYETLYQE